MNKDIVVFLLQKDIKELSLLTEGFEKLSEFPEPLLRLAKEKAENILNSLDELENRTETELGAIDYENFGENPQPSQEKDLSYDFEDKNNFDAPLDAELEPQINPNDIESEDFQEITSLAPTVEVENEDLDESEQYIESEHELNEVENTAELDKDEILADEEIVTGQKTEEDLAEIDEKAEFPPIQNEEEHVEAKQPESKPIVIQTNTTLNDTLTQEDNSLGANLANQKIDDIRQAINIGDRFRFQRELFGGNGEVLNKTISYLNQLAKFSEAELFLKSKFKWDENNPHMEEFLQIVKRRYL